MTAPCAECGFAPDTVSVPDAIVTLRTMPRRWRGALALHDEEDEELLRRRPADDRLSAFEHAEQARDALGGVAGGDVVDAITEAAERLAAQTERVDPEQWRDDARRGALLDAVHAAVHHLRAAREVLDAVRRRR